MDERGGRRFSIADPLSFEGTGAEDAAKIAGPERHGVLEGVTVDFRHPELPLIDWEPAPHWHAWSRQHASAKIIFPVEARTGLAKLRTETGLVNYPAVYARPGDKVSVVAVEVRDVDRRFDHPHDRQTRQARLQVERSTGEIYSPPDPMSFYGRTRIREGATRDAFDHLAARICQYAGIVQLEPASLDMSDREIWSDQLEDTAVIAATRSVDAFARLYKSLSDIDRALLRKVINNTAIAGFVLGKIEARKAEKIAAPVANNLRKGSVKVRRDDWTNLARAIWSEHPDWTVNAVANEIAEELGADDDPRSIRRNIEKVMPPTSKTALRRTGQPD